MAKNTLKVFFLLYSLFVFGLSSFLFAEEDKSSLTVRIALTTDVNRFVISADGFYKIIDPATGNVLEEGRHLKKARVLGIPHGIHVGKRFFPFDHIRFIASKDVSLYEQNQKRYRGEIDLVRDKHNNLTIINRLSIEDYVRGVLFHEVDYRWPIEAMKAQAVATRSYAIFQIEENKEQPYDVTSDIYSQVYGGRNAERYRTNVAANRTRGEVLFYQDKILPAYFHANSGGYTEDVHELWKHNMAPLKGVPDEYSIGADHFEWRKNFRSKDVQEILDRHGYSVGTIKDISIVERNRSGRIRKLIVTSRDGRVATISGKEFRYLLGPNVVKSNNYEIEMKGYYFDLIGKGWGHGVGMSQWGAYTMAKKRFSYKEILAYYYPGAVLKKFDEAE